MGRREPCPWVADEKLRSWTPKTSRPTAVQLIVRSRWPLRSHCDPSPSGDRRAVSRRCAQPIDGPPLPIKSVAVPSLWP